MHGAGAAVGDQREVARVASALGRDRPQRPWVIRALAIACTPAAVLGRRSSSVGAIPLERLLAELGRHEQVARGQRPGRMKPRKTFGVGDGRLLAAAAVAGGPRSRARAPGPTGARPRVEPGDRAAAGADLRDIDILGMRRSSPAPRMSLLPVESDPPASYSRARDTALCPRHTQRGPVLYPGNSEAIHAHANALQIGVTDRRRVRGRLAIRRWLLLSTSG